MRVLVSLLLTFTHACGGLGGAADKQTRSEQAKLHFAKEEPEKSCQVAPRTPEAQPRLVPAEIFPELLRLDPANQPARCELGIIARAQDKPSEAVSRFMKVLQTDPAGPPL